MLELSSAQNLIFTAKVLICVSKKMLVSAVKTISLEKPLLCACTSASPLTLRGCESSNVALGKQRQEISFPEATMNLELHEVFF